MTPEQTHELYTCRPAGATVLQKERASVSELSEALVDALAQLRSLEDSQQAQYKRALVYFLLLILHRRELEEHEALITLVNQHAPTMEVKPMAQTMAEKLTERGRTEEKQAGLLRIIQTRFQIPPETLTSQVRAITDFDRLDTLFDRALTAESFDDIDWEDNTQ